MAELGLDGVSDSAGQYLVAIFRAAIPADGPVSTGAVADRLSVQPSSVTEMVGRLDAAGLLRHRPNRGVDLTPIGLDIARELSRRQCVVEGFAPAVEARRALAVGRRLPPRGIERLGHEVDHPCLEACRAGEPGFSGCAKISSRG